jgi:hypothetical protein
VLLGGLEQAAGAFLAVYIVAEIGAATAVKPGQQFSATFTKIVPGWAAIALAVILVVISQVKINSTNRTPARWPGPTPSPASPSATRGGSFSCSWPSRSR